MGRTQRGFTMIEILVVVTIVSVLMGLVVIIIPMAFGERDATITTTRLNTIRANIEKLRSPQMLGQYPSAKMELLKGPKGEAVGKDLGPGNELNRGIETVYVALHLATLNMRLDLKEDAYANLDEDMLTKNPTVSDRLDLFELVDAWGNPYAYFSLGEYKDPTAVTKYLMKTGEVQEEVVPRKNTKTGQYLKKGSFQLFSAGKDELFGTEDDIGNW